MIHLIDCYIFPFSQSKYLIETGKLSLHNLIDFSSINFYVVFIFFSSSHPYKLSAISQKYELRSTFCFDKREAMNIKLFIVFQSFQLHIFLFLCH